MDQKDRGILSATRSLGILLLWGFTFLFVHVVRGDVSRNTVVPVVSLTIPFILNTLHLIAAMVLLEITWKSNTSVQFARHLKKCEHWRTVIGISHALIGLEIFGLYMWQSESLSFLVLAMYGLQCLVRLQTIQKIRKVMMDLPKYPPPSSPNQLLQGRHLEQLTDVTLAVPLHESLTPTPSVSLPSPSAPPDYENIGPSSAPPEYEFFVPSAPREYDLFSPSAPSNTSDDPETPPPFYSVAMQNMSRRLGPRSSPDFPPTYEDILRQSSSVVPEYTNLQIPEVHSSSSPTNSINLRLVEW